MESSPACPSLDDRADGSTCHRRPRHLVVESTRRLAGVAGREGIEYCDAPVARTRQAAIDGTLAVMAGGDPGVVEGIRPLLLCMATDVTYCGPVGSGQMVEQLNNMALFQNVLAIAEAHAIGTAAGLDGALLFDALAKGSADSFALRNHGMKAIVPDQYPVNAFSTSYAIKDIEYALEFGGHHGSRGSRRRADPPGTRSDEGRRMGSRNTSRCCAGPSALRAPAASRGLGQRGGRVNGPRHSGAPNTLASSCRG